MGDYPTEADLQFIRAFKALERPVMELVEYLERIWWMPSWGFKLVKRGQRDVMGKAVWRLELHTGGWSGNEDIIVALQETDFWGFCWEMSRRGGHYWFEIPKWMRAKKEAKK